MRRRTDPILRVPKIIRGFGRRPLGFSLNPIEEVDFWEDPDIIYEEFDESYELDVNWDFFGDPDLDETYDSSDTGPVYDELTFEDYLVALNDSYEYPGWTDTAITYIQESSFQNFTFYFPENYEVESGWNESTVRQNLDGYEGVSVWLDAQDNSRIVLDGYGNVETWINKGALGLTNATQTTVAARPTPVTIDGYQFLDFDGTKSMEVSHAGNWGVNPPVTASSFTFFIVFIADTISTNTTENLNAALINSGNTYGVTLRNTPNRVLGWVNHASTYKQSSQSINLAQPYIACVRGQTEFNLVSAIYTSIDGYSFDKSVDSGPIAINNSISIGINPAGTVFLDGKIGEIIIYKGNLQGQTILKIFEYLKNKWGLI